MSQKGSSTNTGSQIGSDEYNYEEAKINLRLPDEDDEVGEDENGDYYSTLKIPLSKYKMLNADGNAKNQEYMKYRKERDFSPITPNRAAVIRPGMSKDPNVLMSPKVVAKLPEINSPAQNKGL